MKDIDLNQTASEPTPQKVIRYVRALLKNFGYRAAIDRFIDSQTFEAEIRDGLRSDEEDGPEFLHIDLFGYTTFRSQNQLAYAAMDALSWAKSKEEIEIIASLILECPVIPSTRKEEKTIQRHTSKMRKLLLKNKSELVDYV